MEITYEITPADIAAYTKEVNKGTNLHYLQVVITTCVYVLFMFADIVLALVAMFKNDGTIKVTEPQIVIRVGIWLVIVIGSYLVLSQYARSTLAKAAAAPGKNGLFCEHKIVFDESGFTESTDVNRSFHAWESVEKIAETETFVAIQVRLGACYFIPKRAFASKGALLDFINAVPADITRTYTTDIANIRKGTDY
ncbi:MAG: YcxB family protein [Pyrinomonadaceae bacterium]